MRVFFADFTAFRLDFTATRWFFSLKTGGASVYAGLLPGALILLIGFVWLGSLCQAQELESDPVLQQQKNEAIEQKFRQMEARARKNQVSPVSDTGTSAETRAGSGSDSSVSGSGGASGSGGSMILKGSVSTIDAAIAEEQDTVDWYGWYMSARQYLAVMGGLACEPGTPIKFYKNGHIEAQSPDSRCQLSVFGKSFPLPKETRLSAVILPVRSNSAPPASREEILKRTQGGK